MGTTTGTGSIGDYVWNDANHNGIQDAGETGVGGVVVELEDQWGSVLSTTTTAADGSYHFNNLAAGCYQVQFIAPTGSTFTGQHWTADGSFSSGVDSDAWGGNGITQLITLAAGQVNNTIDAGLVFSAPPPATGTASIGDRVWNDANSNGIQDAGEAGVGGVTVKLEDVSGNVLATTTSGADGSYHFNNLAAGSYQVQFVAPTNYIFTGQHWTPDGSFSSGVDSDAWGGNGITQVITLAAGQVNNTIDAGLIYCPPAPPPAATGTANGTVWNDTNDNGIRDGNEVGVGGVVVKLEDVNGNVVATTTTAANGSYSFGNVAPGTYEVQVMTPSGFNFSPAHASGSNSGNDSDVNANGLTSSFTVTAGQTTTNDAGLYCPPAPPPATASLGDFVWSDTNNNGIQDAGEAGVSGVIVKLESASGTVLATTTTASDGSYHFNNLAAGTYEVQVVAPNNYMFSPQHASGSTSSNDSDVNVNGLTAPITLAAGQTDNTIDAGLVYCPPAPPPATASVGDYVWNDTNKNGIQDAGEAGVAGVLVKLEDVNGSVLATTTTAADGSYHFNNLAAGTYEVQFVAPTNYAFTTQNAAGSTAGNDSNANTGGLTSTFTLATGQTDNTIDAGLVYSPPKTASIGDFVWNDANSNGIQDAGEAGVSGVTVKLEDTSGSVLATTTTAADGSYHFNNLAAGNYEVQFVAPTGYSFTALHATGSTAGNDSDADRSGLTQAITLAAGQTNNTIDAGVVANTGTGAIGDYAWTERYPGPYDGVQGTGNNEVAAGGVYVSLEKFNADGTVSYQFTYTDSSGHYLFSNLAAGEYRVHFSMPGIPWNPSATAPSTTGSQYYVLPEHATSDGTRDSDIDPYTMWTNTFTLAPGERNMNIDAGFAYFPQNSSPIVIDLDGNGIHTSSLAQNASAGTFDLLGNGTQVQSGWISSGDAFLAVDTNGNGKIDSRNELFGGAWGDGYAKLASYDTNGDGVIDAKDADFSKLVLWQDKNGNHQSDPGELITLAQAGVTSLVLAHSETQTLDNGNILGETSSAITTSGASLQMTDVYFDYATPAAATPATTATATTAQLLTPSNALLDSAFGSTSTAQVVSVASAGTGTGDAAHSVAQLLSDHASLLAA